MIFTRNQVLLIPNYSFLFIIAIDERQAIKNLEILDFLLFICKDDDNEESNTYESFQKIIESA